MSTTEFPAPFRRNGRLIWDRFDIENEKRRMLGLRPLERDPSKPIEFVTAQQLAREFPFGRRTIGRLVKGRAQPALEG